MEVKRGTSPMGTTKGILEIGGTIREALGKGMEASRPTIKGTGTKGVRDPRGSISTRGVRKTTQGRTVRETR